MIPRWLLIALTTIGVGTLIIAAIGAFGSGIGIGVVLFTEGWSVDEVLMTGFFAARTG